MEAQSEPAKVEDHSMYLHITKKKLVSAGAISLFLREVLNAEIFCTKLDQDTRISFFKTFKLVLLHSKIMKLETASLVGPSCATTEEAKHLLGAVLKHIQSLNEEFVKEETAEIEGVLNML